MRETSDAPEAVMTIEEMSEELATGSGHAGEFDIECGYCGSAFYHRPGICPSRGGMVVSMDNSA